MTWVHLTTLNNPTSTAVRAFCVAFAVAAIGCNGSSSTAEKPAAAAPPPPQENQFKPPAVRVARDLPDVTMDGATGSLPLSSASSWAWSALISLNWPASTAAGMRGAPDLSKNFGQPGTPVWVTMRSKVEVYAGNASATTAPHGVILDPDTGRPINQKDDYGYGDPPQYLYAKGALPACPGQPTVTTPAFISLDETSQINNNQTFAGAAPAVDPQGFNTKPQLIRYAVKMNRAFFSRAIQGQYWYSGSKSPLQQAINNFTQALSGDPDNDPAAPFVNFAPVDPLDNANAKPAGIEIKSAWRPLSASEASSGRFFTTTVRYYEQPDGAPCYREAVWGLVGMHVISFAYEVPWVIWSTFEQADNILTADGKPTEDVNGNRIAGRELPPTTPMLSSDPSVVNPTVTKNGDYCVSPGSRLYFRENPNYGTMPSAGNICVNSRWSPPEPMFVKVNEEAHQAIASYLGTHGNGTSPLMFYKLVGAQGVPVDVDLRNEGFFSTTTSYQSANVTIETDYSLGNFTGNLINGVPSNVLLSGGKPVDYYNTRMLPFQRKRLGFQPMRMGGCAGCHGFAGQAGTDFSFALGNNVSAPEPTDAFATANQQRNYFPRRQP